ncbi:hypothetical protein [Flavobacterium ajazii]|uniref:hypothetical protein n=1 Tax=Flavobacterium ajazii TaxID=2692318 RepID=UPI0013D17712|nr:hypothetical protein [Flavobacterium ajazii]
MARLGRIIILGLFFFVIQVRSQALRQLLINSDAICIVKRDSSITTNELLSDAFERIQTTSHVIVAEWLKPPKGKKIPQEIICKNVSEPAYTLQSNGYGIGEAFNNQEIRYDFLFLKKEKKNYRLILSYSCVGSKAYAIQEAIKKAIEISNLKEDKQRYAASVDFILSEYILNDLANFLADGSYTELMPESTFVRYYKQKGIITDSAILNAANQQRLKKFIISRFKKGESSYEYEKLVPLFYDRFKNETDLAIANCLEVLLKRKEKESESESEFGDNQYEIKKVLSILYACNKSYNLKEYYYSDDDNVFLVAKNLIDEIRKRYLQE